MCGMEGFNESGDEDDFHDSAAAAALMEEGGFPMTSLKDKVA